ncbi:hypothetical protein CVT24_007881 [Panaeolus cyanescens]|uniref:Uncharacterized protein n=1 Tax=Panaeolus cyanescens TaxID=181874 RepID=A0A409YQL7_9AGAR|nr:hypothetical protein CVT24_007881 [Panaeolus cyanescens]
MPVQQVQPPPPVSPTMTASDSHQLSDLNPAQTEGLPIPQPEIPTLPPSIPPPLQDITNWASRNPTFPTQPLKQKASRTTSTVGRATKKALRTQQKVKQDQINEELLDLKDEVAERVAEIAEKHDVSEVKLRQVFDATSRRKERAACNLDALVSLRCSQQYVAKPLLLRIELSKQLSANLISPEEIAKAWVHFKAAKKIQAVGLRSTAKSARADAEHTIRKVTTELENLNERTGVRCLLLASKTHVDDQFAPTMVEVNGSSSFFPDVLKIPADQGLRQYQQHNCTVANAPTAPSNVKERQTFVANKIREGLISITNGACTAMEYIAYDRDIRAKHGVELQGWPGNTPFQSPSTFTNNITLMNLIRLLENNTLHWTAMPRDTVDELLARLADEASSVEKPKRKKRADAGVSRGPSKKAKTSKNSSASTASTSTSTRTRPSKVAAQLPPSRETVDSSDEEEGQSQSSQ